MGDIVLSTDPWGYAKGLFGKTLVTFLLLILSLFTSCNDDPHISRMIKACVKLGKKKYNLEIFGSGFAGPTKVKNYSLVFQCYQKMTIEEARKLIINYTEDFILIAYQDKYVLQDITDPPFDEKKGNFIISLKANSCDFDGVELANGKVAFLKTNSKGYFEKIISEPYAEAYFKVRGTYPPPRN